MAKYDHPSIANQHPSMTVHNKQLSSQLSHFNDADNSQSLITKPVSNELNCGLTSKGCSKEHFVNSDNWNTSEEAKQSVMGPENTLINLEGDYKTASTTSGMSREDIIARRKLKVIDLRKKKKLEKQQPTKLERQPPTTITSDFELSSTSEDYPDLSTARSSKKKVKNYRLDRTNEIENNTEDSRRNRGMEKSWKPKVKDPISIDIGQALQTKYEKTKVFTKKTDPTAQRNIIKGNILDADCPQLKKGKVRPDKQRKPTKLKKQILLERNERQIVQHEQVESSQCSNATVLSQNTDCECSVEDKMIFTKDDSQGTIDATLSVVNDGISSLLMSSTVVNNDNKSGSNDNRKNSNNQQHLKNFESLNIIHSRKFREYCTNCLTDEVISSVCALLEKLAYFQDRTYARDPIKAQAKRRYVAGINQANKYLIVKKVKLLVIAPDLEKNSGEGGLDSIITNFKNEADNQDVPYVFGPKRYRLGKAVSKRALVSCVAVLSYDGAEEQFHTVLRALGDAKLKYQALISGDSNHSDKKDSRQPSIEATVDEDYVSADDVTSSLLAALKGDFSPADKLLNAIQRTNWSSV